MRTDKVVIHGTLENITTVEYSRHQNTVQLETTFVIKNDDVQTTHTMPGLVLPDSIGHKVEYTVTAILGPQISDGYTVPPPPFLGQKHTLLDIALNRTYEGISRG
jgi:hypothetical protein